MRRPANNTGSDHLYVLESSCGHIKIGRAANVEARIRGLRNMVPPSVSLSLIAVADYHGDWEYGMHEAFAEFRVRGEWFTAEAGAKLKALLARAPLDRIARQLAKPSARAKGQRLTGPEDRRGRKWVGTRPPQR